MKISSTLNNKYLLCSFALLGAFLIPRFTHLFPLALLIFSTIYLVCIELNSIAKITMVLIKIFFINYNVEIFYIIATVSPILYLKKNCSIDQTINLICFFSYPKIIVLIYHLFSNISLNHYIYEPIQYRDYTLHLVTFFPFFLLNFNKNYKVGAFHTLVFYFLAFITNSRACVYLITLSIIILFLCRKKFTDLIFITLAIPAIYIYKISTNSDFYGELIQRFKFGIYSPTRFNYDYPMAIDKIINNNDLTINPHNLYLFTWMNKGLLSAAILVLISILAHVIGISNLRKNIYDKLYIAVFISFISYSIFSIFENSISYLMFIYFFYFIQKIIIKSNQK